MSWADDGFDCRPPPAPGEIWRDVTPVLSEYDEEVNGAGERRHRRRYRLVPRRSGRGGDMLVGEWMPGPAPGSRIP